MNMRSEFLGGSLKTGQASTKPAVGKMQVQALFKGGKKAEKNVKQGTQKLAQKAQKAVKKVRTGESSCRYLDPY